LVGVSRTMACSKVVCVVLKLVDDNMSCQAAPLPWHVQCVLTYSRPFVWKDLPQFQLPLEYKALRTVGLCGYPIF
jgi:hypothetical protein